MVFSDFRHGIFNRDTIPQLTKAMPGDVFKVADSQVASRWGNILEFHGFDLITPNEREARFALAIRTRVVRPLALALYEQADCKTLILKLGERGFMTCRSARTTRTSLVLRARQLCRRVVDAGRRRRRPARLCTLSQLYRQRA